MATSYQGFLIELYEEYLSEASFLYERRRISITKPDSIWTDLANFENRLEAHIDGLMVGDELAVKTCRERAAKGDFGELYAALCVFCRHNRKDIVMELLDHLDPGDAEKWQAVEDALKYEAPAAWREELVRALDFGAPASKVKALARVCGWRRWDVTAQLLAVLKEGSPACWADVAWALGRSKAPPCTTLLFELLNHKEEAVCCAAALALLRRGEPQTSAYLQKKANTQTWPYLPLALAGGRSVVQDFTRKAEPSQVTPDLLVTLGLLGAPSSVPYLVFHLGDPALAPAAALALQTITAADLCEDVFVPDVVHEDELFEHEKGTLKQGAPAVRPDGKLYGTKARQLSLDQQQWKKWWSSKATHFKPELCYRHGEPSGPQRAVTSLDSEATPNRIRQLIVEELAIRYGCDVPLETNMFVGDQKRALAKIREWARINGSRFQPGACYFNAKMVA